MKIVYIAHPIATDEKFNTEQNIQDILRILRRINLDRDDKEYCETVPVAPYLGDVLSMDDSVMFHRKRGLTNCEELIHTGMFDELWLTGHKVSVGMQYEVELFKLQGKPIINLIGKI